MTEEQLEGVPRISHVLEQSGVMPNLWNYLEGSADPEAAKIAKVHRDLGDLGDDCPLEAICLAAGIPPKKALLLITAEVFDQSSQTSDLLAAAQHTEVVKATIRSAVTLDGQKDREMILKHSKFLPIPKTSFVNVRGDHAVIGGTQQNLTVLPAIEDSVKRMADRFNELAPPEIPQLEAAEEFEEGEDDEE